MSSIAPLPRSVLRFTISTPQAVSGQFADQPLQSDGFAELTRKQIQRGVHTSVRQLEADIHAFIETHNKQPKPYRWTKSADQILAAVKRFCQTVDHTLCGEL